MEISIVIPAFNEEKRIGGTVRRFLSYLQQNFRQYELIVVDDGSVDKTQDVLKAITQERAEVRIFRNQTNSGKGHAVKQGVLQAEGVLVFFADADLSTPPEEIKHFADLFKTSSASVLIGSRNVAGADIKTTQPLYRRVLGRIFNACVRQITGLSFKDTQCGFKGFRREAAHEIFKRTTENRFSFDVEVLLIAKKMGYEIKEIPIVWSNDSESKINPVRDGLKMLLDLFMIKQKCK